MTGSLRHVRRRSPIGVRCEARAATTARSRVAWCAHVTGLLRWLVSDGDTAATRAKAKRALTRCPKNAGRQVGLLRVLVGELGAAADLLSKAPGLGWSREDHPGHVVFPLLAVLLANGTTGKINDTLLAEIESTGRDPVEAFADDTAERRPRLAIPSIGALTQVMRAGIKVTDADRDVAVKAMRIAAEKRVEGILGNSRRRHYGHAALLVASCLAFAPKRRASELSKWYAELRQQYVRRSAFRQELTRAFASLGVPAPA